MDELLDKIDGLESELDACLEVLVRRIRGEADLASAAEWVRLNYPKFRLTTQPEAKWDGVPESYAYVIGEGRTLVCLGTFHEKPALFVGRTDNPRPPGNRIHGDQPFLRNLVSPGDPVFVFPDQDHADRVMRAIVGPYIEDTEESPYPPPHRARPLPQEDPA